MAVSAEMTDMIQCKPVLFVAAMVWFRFMVAFCGVWCGLWRLARSLRCCGRRNKVRKRKSESDV